MLWFGLKTQQLYSSGTGSALVVSLPLIGAKRIFYSYSSKLAVTMGKDSKSIKKKNYCRKRSPSRPFYGTKTQKCIFGPLEGPKSKSKSGFFKNVPKTDKF